MIFCGETPGQDQEVKWNLRKEEDYSLTDRGNRRASPSHPFAVSCGLFLQGGTATIFLPSLLQPKQKSLAEAPKEKHKVISDFMLWVPIPDGPLIFGGKLILKLIVIFKR
jgi:hypothetical protein